MIYLRFPQELCISVITAAVPTHPFFDKSLKVIRLLEKTHFDSTSVPYSGTLR